MTEPRNVNAKTKIQAVCRYRNIHWEALPETDCIHYLLQKTERLDTMRINIRNYTTKDTNDAVNIWNSVVSEGSAFPQTELLTSESGEAFFLSQSYTGIACEEETGEIVGLYILHPNNVGRCGHICNASYAVASALRGQHIGEQLVRDCMKTAKDLGYRILQFNAVVKSNHAALHLYEKLGFQQLGVIPGGFLNKDGVYEDIIPHYHLL